MTPGELVDRRYRLEEQLGEGAFGNVWRATDLQAGGNVAIKFVRHDSASAAALRRFGMEIETLSHFDHPNIVRLFHSGIEDGQAFLVTEYVGGETLSAWMYGGWSLEDRIEVSRQIARALDHAHQRNVVHRDLKPANVMVEYGEPIRVKVLDFGVAKGLGEAWPDVTKTGHVVGTPGYMSPEQLTGETLTHRTDQYSLGVVLFELFEGRPPFTGSTGLELALRHVKEVPPPLSPSRPDHLRHVIARLLEKEPQRRFSDMKAVIAALESSPDHWTQRSTVERVDPPTLERPPSTPQRAVRDATQPLPARTSWTTLALALITMTAIAGVVGVFSKRPEQPHPTAATERVVALMRTPPPKAVAKTLEASVESKVSPDAASDAGRGDLGAAAVVPNGSAGCGTPFGKSGLQKIVTIAEDLQPTEVLMWVPAGYDEMTAHPAVLMYHDMVQTPQGLHEMTEFGELAQKANAILIFPADDFVTSTWRTPEALQDSVSDFELVARTLCIDRTKVAAFGYGSGGAAAERVKCETPLQISSVVVNAYRLRPKQNPCDGATPVPYLLLAPMNGVDPVEGGRDCLTGLVVSLEEHEAHERKVNRCKGRRREEGKYNTSICYTWDCDAPFVSCHLDGGRPWPTTSRRVDCEGVGAKFPFRSKSLEFIAVHW